MSIYEYRCGHCGARVEVSVWNCSSGGTCPHCGSPLVDRLLSVPFISSGRTQRETGRTGCGRERNHEKEGCVNRASKESAFDRMVEEIQRQVIEDERAIYSQKVIEEYYNPKNLGRRSDPDAVGIVHGWCGDTMEIYLRMNGSRIEEATFMTDGCGPTVACGSKLTTMVRGMSLDQARQIEQADLVSALDGLPEESLHCAELAVNTLREAINHCEKGEEIPRLSENTGGE